MKKSILMLILILELVIGFSYLVGFYAGMNECKRIYKNEVVLDKE